jgi:hypothetical protein
LEISYEKSAKTVPEAKIQISISPTKGATAVMARVFATGNQDPFVVAPRSSTIYDKEPPTKYSITWDPTTISMPAFHVLRTLTGIQSTESDSSDNISERPIDLSVTVVSFESL